MGADTDVVLECRELSKTYGRVRALKAATLTLRRGEAVTCALEAQDTEHGVVGWRVVEYPADPAHTRAFSETIPTIAEATTGFVSSCWIP